MSHNYRQARKNGYVHNDGYRISLQTILQERGLPREKRLRANVEAVREAIEDMKAQNILSQMHPFDEELVHAPSKGRPKIADAIWNLYPSAEFVDEIIEGNKEMKQAHRQAGGNKAKGTSARIRRRARPGEIGESPENDEKAGGNKGERSHRPGEIRAKVSKSVLLSLEGRGK